MARETITMRQAICIVVMFLTGNLVLSSLSPEAEQDTWICILIAAAVFIPLLLVYARIMRLYPEKDIFQIMEAVLGKVAAKALTALLFWYAIHLFSIVIRNFAEFVRIASMPETPQLPIMIIMMLLAVYIVKGGAESYGKWSVFSLSVVIVSVIMITLLSLNKMDVSNIQPVLAHNFGALSSGAFSLLTSPIAESVLFLSLANTIKKSDSPRRLYFWGLAIAVLLMLTAMWRNLFVLGAPFMKAAYYTSYTTARIINIGNVITRLEGLLLMNIILSGIGKSMLCLQFAVKGAASLFGVRSYKSMAMPVGLFGLAFSAIIFKNTMELFQFSKVYGYYAVPFQTAIPLIIWIAAEIKVRKNRKPAAPGREENAGSSSGSSQKAAQDVC